MELGTWTIEGRPSIKDRLEKLLENFKDWQLEARTLDEAIHYACLRTYIEGYMVKCHLIKDEEIPEDIKKLSEESK